ncbi:hypothetical protein COB64_03855 [Candidatus Wolfebacteria bacterium]|nr:MAG: hypothetical protein COB64_03855 [Candidatus Wolfebacteria bacterium]
MKQLPDENRISYFARTNFRNKGNKFGIKKGDRKSHIYTIGKTSTGKSTFLANLMNSDLQNGEGFCLIDPHGDLALKILRMIPEKRKSDVILFNPGQSDHSISLNILQVSSNEDKYQIASSFISILKKIYGDSWGPRLEYTLRNTLLTILEFPEMGTLLWIPKLLTNQAFRTEIVSNIHDEYLRVFWVDEFMKYTPRFRQEVISPILNKIGQFLSNPNIRRIFQKPRSNFNFREIMDNGKILIANLSKGKIGEDNAALLGAMLVSKIESAAYSRQNIPEEKRRSFYLYADEFQSYTTSSFASILSEARKFNLSLILAHQHLHQLDPLTRGAIFGNVGTIISFRVGAEDAEYLAEEFYPKFNKGDFLDLPNYHMYLRMMINGEISKGFSAKVLNI